jgi:hypothetical protein
MICRLEVGDTAGWKPALRTRGATGKSRRASIALQGVALG